MNIWVNGCFDILHVGHINLLWFAKLYKTNAATLHDCMKQNKLIVGIDSDDRVKFLKGNDRPINNVETRGTIMANLKMVDEVVIFHDDDELRYFIKAYNIDYIVVGDHYRNKEVIGSENAKYGVVFYKTDGRSTTNIINKIKNLNL